MTDRACDARADFLLYGRLYVPNPRLDALYVHRLSPTLQALVSLITVPSPAPPPTLTWENTDPAASLSASTSSVAGASGPTSGPLARLSELELKLQQDTGRWSAEYSYAVGDGMWGLRGLYNFGRWGEPGAASTAVPVSPGTGGAGPEMRERAVDEEDEMPAGLKGRWSAGGEIYFSAQERSAGVSTGVRFTTIPESAGGPPQPPTYISATINPIMGQLSTAYAVRVGRDASLASRFDFNLYSYDADLTVGGEWFQRRTPAKDKAREEEHKAGATFDAFGRGADDEETKRRRRNNDAEDEVLGVLKVRASTNAVRLASSPSIPRGLADRDFPSGRRHAVGRPIRRLHRLGRTRRRHPSRNPKSRTHQSHPEYRAVGVLLGLTMLGLFVGRNAGLGTDPFHLLFCKCLFCPPQNSSFAVGPAMMILMTPLPSSPLPV